VALDNARMHAFIYLRGKKTSWKRPEKRLTASARTRGDIKLVGGANGANKGRFTTRKYASQW